jgi:hypothetical protein
MSSLTSTLNPKNLTEINPPEIEDTYQDINSDEFDEYSDYEQEEEGDRQNPALEKLVDQSKPPRSIPRAYSSPTLIVHAKFSEDDIDHMYTYLKEAGKFV